MIFPNVRGSSGYGKDFLTLDNGMKRQDAVKDIGALLDWIKTQDDLDAITGQPPLRGGHNGGARIDRGPARVAVADADRSHDLPAP